MQNVLGRYCFLANAALGERNILRNASVQVMGDHDHVEGFFSCIHRVGSGRSCRSWEDICLTAHLHDVRSMSAACAFGVKTVNGSAFEGSDGIFDKAALVQRVSVDSDLHIHVIGDREAAVDGGRGRAPVLMKLQAACSGLDLLNETQWRACIALAKNTKIYGKGIGGLEHSVNMPGSWRTGRGSCPRSRPRAAPHYCGKTRIQRLLDLLRADVVDMRVDATGGDDATFAGDHLSSRSDNYFDLRLHIGIASLAYCNNTPILDANIGLRNSPMIENQRVGDYGIDRALNPRALRLTHAVAD